MINAVYNQVNTVVNVMCELTVEILEHPRIKSRHDIDARIKYNEIIPKGPPNIYISLYYNTERRLRLQIM